MPDQNCPKINLLKLWSFNAGLANAQMPFSMLNVGTPRVISNQIKTHLTEDRGSCTDDTPRPTPQVDPVQPTQCQLADVTILVDGSDSISRNQWATQTLAVSSWMKGYWHDSPNTQITVLQFSDIVAPMFGPAFEGDESNWASTISQTEQISSSTSLHKALKHVTSDSFELERARKLTSTNGRLDQRFRMLFVLSDGWPTDTNFGELSNDVNDKFDIIIAVGVGEEAEIDTLAQTIQQLRFRPEQTHLTAVSDYNQLRDGIPLIHRKVCALEHRMVLGRKKRNFTPVQLNRKKRQIANRGPRPDSFNFSSECDDSGFCNCKCTMPIIEISGIQGPRGIQGPTGANGTDGEPGREGNDGRDGANGRDGNRGEEGDKGNSGENGADGRGGSHGVEGPQGARGEEGRPGPKGPPGKARDAQTGAEGERGDKGSRGGNGQRGQDGQGGVKGPAGKDGDGGRPGDIGEPGPDGRNGQPGDADDGECGPIGRPGQSGEAGYNGDDGNDGADGVDGPRGAAGDAGRKGNSGPSGSKGASGDEGDPGKHGAHGNEGANGLSGKEGDRGMNGFNGDQGPKGPRSQDGVDGAQGEPGLAGVAGLNGNVGKPGMPGNNGDEGMPGDDGQDGDDGPAGSPGDHGDEGEKGRKGQLGVQGRPGEVDAERLYQKIKEMVRQKMYPNGCPAKCEPKDKKAPVSPMIPLNAVFLVDGSDSIRSGTNDGRDEWVTATNAIKETVEKLDINFFSLVQFSKDNVDHIENFNVKRDGKDAAKYEIENELRDTQMKDTTNTYHALEHISTMHFAEENSEAAQDVLFVITDGEPRDDEDSSYVDEVLIKVRDKFDYVFVAVIGEEMRQSYADYSGIQGKIHTSPIYIDDYESMARKLVPHFTRTSKASFDQFIRMKRSLKKRSTRRTRRIFKTKFD